MSKNVDIEYFKNYQEYLDSHITEEDIKYLRDIDLIRLKILHTDNVLSKENFDKIKNKKEIAK